MNINTIAKKISSLVRKHVGNLKKWLLYTLLMFAGISGMLVFLLGIVPIPTSAFMLHRHLEDFQSDHGFIRINQQWVNENNISPYVFGAVIAAEDQLFLQHHGFDLDAIYSAVKTFNSGGKLRGASTISQQVAKNLFLSPSRSFWRKAFEAWFTLLIEILWTKDRILLVYVNIAEFGDHLFGIEAASQQYFSTSADQLTASQAALLAATLPNPRIYSAQNPTATLKKKQFWIMSQMRNLGYLH